MACLLLPLSLELRGLRNAWQNPTHKRAHEPSGLRVRIMHDTAAGEKPHNGHLPEVYDTNFRKQ